MLLPSKKSVFPFSTINSINSCNRMWGTLLQTDLLTLSLKDWCNPSILNKSRRNKKKALLGVQTNDSKEAQCFPTSHYLTFTNIRYCFYLTRVVLRASGLKKLPRVADINTNCQVLHPVLHLNIYSPPPPALARVLSHNVVHTDKQEHEVLVSGGTENLIKKIGFFQFSFSKQAIVKSHVK